jgi:hypothetical protein
VSITDEFELLLLTCYTLKRLPQNGELYDQDAEFLEWLLNLTSYVAEAEKYEMERNGQTQPVYLDDTRTPKETPEYVPF